MSFHSKWCLQFLFQLKPYMFKNLPSTNFSLNSLYFWFDKALIGDVNTALVKFLIAKATAYSATTVFPAEVWAATRTQCPYSILYIALFWKSSSSKGYVIAGLGIISAKRFISDSSTSCQIYFWLITDSISEVYCLRATMEESGSWEFWSDCKKSLSLPMIKSMSLKSSLIY